ncbi:MAG: succinylglutamate desuccinylase/aspartoacylase family protein [Rhodospirillaceae bacterium]|jgi:predicted deacylase
MSQAEPLWAKQKEGRTFTKIHVTQTLFNDNMTLPLHVVTGKQDGPTVGILTLVHGDEFLTAMAVRALLEKIDTADLKGRIAAIPVANTFAMAAFNRQTPEMHGKTDLHEVSPGNPKGNLTQMVAAKVRENLLDHVDLYLDFHTGGQGGRLQSRIDYDNEGPQELQNKCFELSRMFCSQFVHHNNLIGTASRYLHTRNVPGINPEVGGVYLGPDATNAYLDEMTHGLYNVLAAFGMLPNVNPQKPPKQLHFGVKSRFEINPSKGGYLRSNFEQKSDLGTLITKGTVLGEIIDLHSFEVIEQLKAPVDGYLFCGRYSGVLEAGTKAYFIAEESTSEWLD